MDEIYIPELTIQLIEKDIKDAIYELQTESKKINDSIKSLITTTELLKSAWTTSEGIITTDKIKKLTSSLEENSKKIINQSNITDNITHEII